MMKKEKWRVRHTVDELITIIEALKHEGLWEKAKGKVDAVFMSRVRNGCPEFPDIVHGHEWCRRYSIQDYYKLIVEGYRKIEQSAFK